MKETKLDIEDFSFSIDKCDKKKNKDLKIFLGGMIIGSGMTVCSAAVVNLCEDPGLRIILYTWQAIPWQIWAIGLIIFICLFWYFKRKFQEKIYK